MNDESIYIYITIKFSIITNFSDKIVLGTIGIDLNINL